MKEAKLIKTICFREFRANEVYPADLNNDGQMELLFLQSPGCIQSKVYKGSSGDELFDEQREHYCLTAVDRNGNIMWQFGKPYLASLNFSMHVADQMVWAENLDGDGKTEVVLIWMDKLVILDGATGKEIRSTRLKYDNYTIVRPFSSKDGTRLLIKNTEMAYSPFWYGDPTRIYDLQLNPVSDFIKTVGSGHSPRAYDINNDGCEELLIFQR